VIRCRPTPIRYGVTNWDVADRPSIASRCY